ncbi:hypothetical protein [Pseudonocardia sp. WMMC193]|uniref:hypothetical protein n=1 Tax=Pseudonocardia sp. WMMC193 TaxID=2911965 RepID=UPI001F16311E|nr:hypothetical protein [Pseudonocardia sp. WMMC193]MCF7552683.1 hypothetical protein [Pseudonocardia sp. WMMC193]
MTRAATDRADCQLRVRADPGGEQDTAGRCVAEGRIVGGIPEAQGHLVQVFRLGRAVTTGLLITAGAGLPSDVVPNPIFARMTPVRWWDYALITAAVLLGALWSGTASDARRRQAVRWSVLIAGVTLLAVGCPSCNKAAVALLGDAGAMSTWGTLQPGLGLATLVVAAVVLIGRSTPFWESRSTVKTGRLGLGRSA